MNTSMKSLTSWAPACPGASTTYVDGTRLRDLRDLRDLRLEQRIQDEQGRSVFALGDMKSQAPATAHMGATPAGGVSGPYPWRRPV
ncbi:hypothetical protein [Actinomadura opuntiae]|uniref:hypothetical protein n=1 Tax=Actinomadura sp. OS1-43 TaxID=604315 RepID=UPI00255AF5EE|nr:hypothetical protein [Actinomadura sp. OS1-43]MDL4819066.1 hypothetical protein [Actinomadura sp. OS1-43]